MSTPRKTLPGSLKERLTDVTTGLYMISSTCGLVDAVCFLALGGVFAEMMTGNLLLMALSIGTGRAESARYIPAIAAFSLGALIGGLLLRFGTVWPLVLTSIVFSLAMIPLMFGKKPL